MNILILQGSPRANGNTAWRYRNYTEPSCWPGVMDIKWQWRVLFKVTEESKGVDAHWTMPAL